jgi:hypothetical protein
VEIPVKKKHIAGKGLYGYPRTHSGNSRKKTKKTFHGYSDPYDKSAHALVLWPNMKTSMVHGGDVAHIGLRAEAIRAKMKAQQEGN